MRSTSEERVRHVRLRAQGLWPPRAVTPEAVVRGVVGLQAQDAAAARLGVRVRSRGLGAGELVEAERRLSVVRTWCMRGTLHLVAAEDVGWLVGLLGPAAAAASVRRREALGLDARTLRAGWRVLGRALEEAGSLTREEIAARLSAEGIDLAGQALYHFLRHMALEGRIALGPDRDGRVTHVPVREWSAGAAGDVDGWAVELARRYVTGYGPAGLDDFVAWTGLGRVAAREAWEALSGETVEVRATGGRLRVSEQQAHRLEEPVPDGPIVHLLPAYDAYVLGYRGRDPIVARADAKRLQPGGGVVRAALLVDGRVAGTWTVRRRPSRVEVRVEPFRRLSAGVRRALEAEIEDTKRFLGARAAMTAEVCRHP